MPYESALAQAEAVKKREVSREELVREHLARIAALNPQLNAFTDVCVKTALRHARRADARRKEPLSPLDGAVTGVKDLNMVRGTFTRFGAVATRYFVAPIDDAIAARLKQAGMTLIGKLATSEFGTSPVTEPRIHGPTTNPYLPGHNAGGSSGGSGAAVGSRLLMLAHGNDGAGSIRIPAAFCGVFGFKPTHTLVPNPAEGVDKHQLTANGPLATTVKDLAAMTDALALLVGDRALLPRVDASPRKPLRVRVSFDSAIAKTVPEIRDVVRRVATWFERTGYAVDEAPWLDGSVEEFVPIWSRQAADIPIPFDAGMTPVTRWLRAVGRPLKHADVARQKAELEARVDRWFAPADVWISPTVGSYAPKNGAFSSMDGMSAFHASASIGAFTAAFNLSGQPAGTVPMGYGPGGEPIGVQVVAKRGEDLLVLQLMRALELEFAADRLAKSPRIR